jgi:hypothetical protein
VQPGFMSKSGRTPKRFSAAWAVHATLGETGRGGTGAKENPAEAGLTRSAL